MFKGLLNRASSTISGLVLRYVARTSVAIPFVVALGFALAAVAGMLVERFGAVLGYWVMAGGLAAIGLVATLLVSFKEHEEEIEDERAERTDTVHLATEVGRELPIGLLGAIFSVPGGKAIGLSAMRMLGRNLPLVALLAMITALFWPPSEDQREINVKEGAR